MSLRSIALFALAVFALVACGPSAAQIKTARDGRYRASASEVFQRTVAALKDNGHKVKAADPVAGKAVTEEKFYEVDGTTMSRDSDGRPLMTSAGAIILMLEATVVPDGDVFKVDVTPRVLRMREGYAAAIPIEPGNPEMPGWVVGIVDNVYVSVHSSLKASAVAPGS
jgi:hypothetical protein